MTRAGSKTAGAGGLRRRLACLLLVAGCCALWPLYAADEGYASQREELVREIERGVRATSAHTDMRRLSKAVLAAISAVPRHEFVPVELRQYAYEDRPLPIGEGQTISQPFVVALMTELAGIGPESVVLEIGTGSGYQAAVLAEIAKQVYTIEIVEPLGRRAAEVLARLGYANVEVRIGDGYAGWPEKAPFDAIVVTAAPEQVPAPLLEQLATGGRLVIPVGPEGRTQSLRLIKKRADGAIATEDVLPVIFVPFTR